MSEFIEKSYWLSDFSDELLDEDGLLREDSRYISFIFADGANTYYPIIVRINDYVSDEVLEDIRKTIYGKRDEYWDTHECDVDDQMIYDLMQVYAKKHDFTFDLINVDLNMDFARY